VAPFQQPSGRLLKKTHMLRCAQIASLQRTVSTPPLVDFSHASPLDLFEQPASNFLSNLLLPDFIFDASYVRQLSIFVPSAVSAAGILAADHPVNRERSGAAKQNR
jgi:hypothetical protein